MNNDLISRESTIEELDKICCPDFVPEWYENALYEMKDTLMSILQELPSIQPDTRSRAGRWIDVYDEHIGIDYQCSCCGKKVYTAKQYDLTGKGYAYEFCPRCGAEMESDID